MIFSRLLALHSVIRMAQLHVKSLLLKNTWKSLTLSSILGKFLFLLLDELLTLCLLDVQPETFFSDHGLRTRPPCFCHITKLPTHHEHCCRTERTSREASVTDGIVILRSAPKAHPSPEPELDS